MVRSQLETMWKMQLSTMPCVPVHKNLYYKICLTPWIVFEAMIYSLYTCTTNVSLILWIIAVFWWSIIIESQLVYHPDGDNWLWKDIINDRIKFLPFTDLSHGHYQTSLVKKYVQKINMDDKSGTWNIFIMCQQRTMIINDLHIE